MKTRFGYEVSTTSRERVGPSQSEIGNWQWYDPFAIARWY